MITGEDIISGDLVLESSLQSFFFENLNRFNGQLSDPLQSEFIYYASRLLDRYALCENFFETVDGKIQEKVLGVKLLKTSQQLPKQKATEIRDVGDTALMLCGFFPSAIENKIVSPSYYYDIGSVAYQNLNALIPEYMDQKGFYASLSKLFYQLAQLLSVMAQSFKYDENELIIGHKVLKAG